MHEITATVQKRRQMPVGEVSKGLLCFV